MADKEIEINVKANADKTAIVDLAASMKELHDETENTQEALENAGTAVGQINSESLDAVSDSIADADESLSGLAQSADDTGSSFEDVSGAVDDVASSLGGLSSDPVDSVKESAEETSGAFDRLSDSILGADESISMVDAMAGAEMSGQLVSGYQSLADSAGNYNDTMVKLGYALNGTSMSVEQAEQKYGSLIKTMTETTGRGAGAARAHLINLGNVGIKNQQILSDSFNGISKAAFQMNKDFDTVESSFQRVTLSGMLGSRQLIQFGLNMNDVAAVMGVSADEAKKKFKELDTETRASILATAMNQKFGADVTENYKNSYEHLNEELQRAKDYLMRSVGEALLPVVIPAIKTAADVVNAFAKGFKALPDPIKNVVGGFLSLSVGLTVAGTLFSTFTKFIGFALSPYISLIGHIRNSIPYIRSAAIAVKNLGTAFLTSAAKALRSAAVWLVNAGRMAASTIATWAQTAAQWALNIAMDANPIMLVVIAIIALIAVLGYLYFNNEQVRQAIDGLGQSFVLAGQIIYNAVTGFVSWVISALEGLWQYITTLGGLLPEQISITGNSIIDGILSVVIFLFTLPLQIAMIFANIIAQTLGFGNNFVQNMFNSAQRSVSNFISQISQMPSKLMAELNEMLSAVGRWAETLPQKFWEAGVNAVKNFLNALGIHSPGTMQRNLVWEISEMSRRTPIEGRDLISNIGALGYNVVKSFGNPELNIGVSASKINEELDLGAKYSSDHFDVENLFDKLSDSFKNNVGNGDITINVYGDIDNDKRIRDIVEAVRRELSWNNKTAGRVI